MLVPVNRRISRVVPPPNIHAVGFLPLTHRAPFFKYTLSPTLKPDGAGGGVGEGVDGVA